MRVHSTAASFLAVLALTGIASVCGARLCQGQEVLFADDFKKADPTWPVEGTIVAIDDGLLTVRPPVNSDRTILNGGACSKT